MLKRTLKRIILSALTVGCLCGAHSQPPIAAADEAHQAMKFFVAEAAGGKMLKGVQVIAVDRGGKLSTLTETDEYGIAVVQKNVLASAPAVLFCREGFFCGAFRLDSEGFFGYDERFIQLAPFALR